MAHLDRAFRSRIITTAHWDSTSTPPSKLWVRDKHPHTLQMRLTATDTVTFTVVLRQQYRTSIKKRLPFPLDKPGVDLKDSTLHVPHGIVFLLIINDRDLKSCCLSSRNSPFGEHSNYSVEEVVPFSGLESLGKRFAAVVVEKMWFYKGVLNVNVFKNVF